MYSIEPKIVIASGAFDPLHSGHIEYLTAAKKLGDILVVAVNSDHWLIKTRGTYFMPWTERAAIIKALKPVNDVIAFDDSDLSATSAIRIVKQQYPNSYIVFANGGSVTPDDIPEKTEKGINFEFGVGSDSSESSVSILRRYAQYTRNILDLESVPFKGYT